VSNRERKAAFARLVCANVPSVIAALVCLAGLFAAFTLLFVLPASWSLAGLMTILLVAGIRCSRRWAQQEILLVQMQFSSYERNQTCTRSPNSFAENDESNSSTDVYGMPSQAVFDCR
jgi:hypothetical protein